MARNGSGTMSILNSFSANTTIESAKVNANFTDVASEITGSLPRNGEAGMTGQLKASDGTSGAPGITWGSDLDCGFYRSASNTIAVAGTLTTNGTNKVDAFPAGTVMLFMQTAAPTGWTKDTTHNNKAIRIVSGTASSGGTTAFTSVFTSRTISTANLPAHTHDVIGNTGTAGGKITTIYYNKAPVGGATGDRIDALSTTDLGEGSQAFQTADDHSHLISFVSSSVGSGTAMDFAVQYVDVIAASKDA